MKVERKPTCDRSPNAFQRGVSGRHLLLDCGGIESEILTDPHAIRALLMAAAHAGNLHPVAEPLIVAFPPVTPELPGGVTGVVLLGESHLTIHTYPEHGYAAVDVFTCGETAAPESVVQYFLENLCPETHRSTSIIRGED